MVSEAAPTVRGEKELARAVTARQVMRTGQMRRIKKAVVEGCDDHPKGCYIRLSYAAIKNSEERTDCVVDYDEHGNVVGIELYDGLGKRKKHKLNK